MKYLTIDNFTDLTRDELIDMSVRHVLKNGAPSATLNAWNEIVCSYDGIGCAAAVFLKPEVRNDVASHKTWADLVARDEVPDHQNETVRLLQMCHDDAARAAYDYDQGTSIDNAKFVENFKKRVRDNFGDIPALTQTQEATP